MNFLGIFCNTPLGHIFRKLVTKFGWPIMAETSLNRGAPVLEFSLDKLFLSKKNSNFTEGHKFQTYLNFEMR